MPVILQLFLNAVCIFITIIIKTDFVQFDYCSVCFKENTCNIFIFSKPTKVHDEQYVSRHDILHNSGKIQLTIEKFKRISCHQMSTSSSSLVGRHLMLCINAFLVLHDIPFGAKHNEHFEK
jgi:hypothetical protein